ncbi:alpha/beta hydrolase [Phycicoccus avicenniae]|uniref:alpha/beta hydrolase n=1 Tax=Phycicoccus avicenniae TaxID=2828860 RepID=UPI003D276EEC
MTAAPRSPTGAWTWLVRAVAAAAVLVVGWVATTAWEAVLHAHPAYPVLLALTVAGAGVAGWRSRRPRARPGRWRTVGRVVLLLVGILWVAAVAWLRPFGAVQPALDAMRSDRTVAVTESPTRITFSPRSTASDVGLLFQPGARVDARAYAAVLRPLAEAGHPVVVVKQPLGIGFLATSALDGARAEHPEVTRWVVGGHSLGGTVAALEADAADDDATAPAAGLLLFASYPASDVSRSLTAAVASVSGTRDGLATPADIAASRALLPPGTVFTVVEGGSHAQFGDYGAQPGDGTATLDHDEARRQISAAALALLDSLDR